MDGWKAGRRISGLREQWEHFAKREELIKSHKDRIWDLILWTALVKGKGKVPLPLLPSPWQLLLVEGGGFSTESRESLRILLNPVLQKDINK